VLTFRQLLAKLLLPTLLVGAFFFFKLNADISEWKALLTIAAGAYLGVLFLWFDSALMCKQYQENGEVTLITRSLPFILSYAAVAFWMVTSSASLVGSAMAVGIGSSLLVEMTHLRLDTEGFNQRFLKHLTRPFSQQEIGTMVAIGWLFLFVITALMFRF